MELHDTTVKLMNGVPVETNDTDGKEKTLAYRILHAHHTPKEDSLFHITFDSLTSHDITYVGIIQSARASGLKQFPVPYVLTNCHNTLCAVGGTINEDDHAFALSCAHRYGGIYVPPNLAVIHSYNREMMSGCGRMILGSDSHTRYGALGTLAIGEGGGELAKQLVGQTYDIETPKVVLIYVHGKVKHGVGPQDVALDLVSKTYTNGFVKNCVLEFAGPGIQNLSQDFRNGIDVMTTETTCLSSIWQTDAITKQYFEQHHRPEAYTELVPEEGAAYDKWIDLDLSKVECMIALPMHPSYALPIKELLKDPRKYLQEAQDRANTQLNGKVTMDLVSKVDKENRVHVDQGIIAGCSGGIYENIVLASRILKGHTAGNERYRLSVYPDSLPMYKALLQNNTVLDLVSSGAVFREAFCGPCFGAGDTPANNELSIRHTTRNFPNREGSKPVEGQLASVALMDARSIDATSRNKGILTPADSIDFDDKVDLPSFDDNIYAERVYNGFGHPNPAYPLVFGPNIKDWPEQPALSRNLLIRIVSHIEDPVTTTDELIPSGETSSYRSNPLRLAEFTLSRRDPGYVAKAKQVQKIAKDSEEVLKVVQLLKQQGITADMSETNIGSAIYAHKPGDGSAREQAASCQRVLGGCANFAKEYATKRYRSNCINWGILPFTTTDCDALQTDTYVYIQDILDSLSKGNPVQAYSVHEDQVKPVHLELQHLSDQEKQILMKGCLINYYKAL